MILGIGIDIIQISRIKNLYEKFGEKFINKIFAEDEIGYCFAKKNPFSCLAARFAVKEAYIKALNVPRGLGFSFKNIILQGKHFGKKKLTPHGNLNKQQKKLGVRNVHISLSHEKEYATAVVILEN